MASILVIGATGGVGHRLCPLLIGQGHQVRGLYRKPEQAAPLHAVGVEAVAGDLMAMGVEDWVRHLQGIDTVVFSAGAAGSGLERTTAIDGEGPVKLVAAMQQCGVRRLYLVSAFPEAGRGQAPKAGFEHYMRTKKQADAAVTATDLDWVILRPGTLEHADGCGRVSAGPALPYAPVARGDVAATLAELIATPAIRREIIELTRGETPVAEAVRCLVRH